MREGKFKNYFWLSSFDYRFDDLQKDKVLNHLVGSQVVVTSFDSGIIRLSPEEIAAGWKMMGKLAVSPVLEESCINQKFVPYDGFDEWWVFKRFDAPIEIQPFVNFSEFLLMTEEEIRNISDPHCDKDSVESKIHLINRFWNQLTEHSPIAYFGDGDNFNFASMNKDLFEAVCSSVKKFENL